MQNRCLALLISPDTNHYRGLAPLASRCGLHLIFSATLRNARPLLARDRFSVIFCSDRTDGCTVPMLLQSLRVAAPDIPVIVLSRHNEWAACLHAMRAGAFDYVAWPPEPAETERIVRLAAALQAAQQLHSAA